MFETKELAIEALSVGESVEYCEICEAWTIIGLDGYPLCQCV